MEDVKRALIVGAGPAGLAAAEILALSGFRVTIAEAMPSPGRKFLMAGKSGLNLTKDEAPAVFKDRIPCRVPVFQSALSNFGPREVRQWAEDLGQPLFAGSTGRVFPVAMKASSLLRAWLNRLDQLNVRLETRMRWVGWENEAWQFETAGGTKLVEADVGVLALGGASWSRLGSNGAWAEVLKREGVEVAPFQPANVGLEIDWSSHMAPYFGSPVKSVQLSADELRSRGEWVITATGIEGGGIYEVSSAVRDGAALAVDLFPDLTEEDVSKRLAKRSKESLSNRLRKLGLDPVRRALAIEWGRPFGGEVKLAARLKAVPVPVAGLMPMDGAISTAGGVSWNGLDGFMLKSRPGVFVAGEMLDWEAPTGGYLLTGCFATGRAAGTQAAKWMGVERGASPSRSPGYFPQEEGEL